MSRRQQPGAVTLRVVDGLRAVPAAAWNALVGEGSPFLEWEWLASLEDAGTVRPETGWLPQHLTVWRGERLIGACPLYLKGHSMGEFVFDHGWAAAAERAGMAYYPKLLVGVPFTPVTGARLLAASGEAGVVVPLLAEALEQVCTEQRLSSVHVNFCLPEEAALLRARGWLVRTGWQYHWTNAGYRSFEDWLQALRSKRRNQTRREQRELAAQGVTLETLAGDAAPPELAPTMYALYRSTIDDNPWGRPYLTERFFTLAFERLRSRLCLVLARQRGEIVAGTFNVQKGEALYGRYWGTLRPLRYLHFNVCYYAAVEHCIAHGLARFEPGAGGEFKHMRGFDARKTLSVHFVRDPRLRVAIADFLAREGAAVEEEIAWFDARTALKRNRPRDA
ncbi:MAG TPA: GNAT family N-acetyltransferase [Candidatus Limnocylindria bacterium]|nr:GNAT family N-acetyltransferase [Candidatus Limnocylindria bacterium]